MNFKVAKKKELQELKFWMGMSVGKYASIKPIIDSK